MRLWVATLLLLTCSLYEELSAIDFFTTESSEWDDLRGQYERIAWQNELQNHKLAYV